MENRNQSRTEMGVLLGRGFRIYGRTLGTGFTATLLCGVLPTLVISVALFYCMLALLRPVFVLMQTILQSALASGLDEYAIGRAVQEVWDSLVMPDGRTMLASGVGMLLAVMLLWPVQLVFAIVLQPLGLGAVAEAQSRMWHGEKMTLSTAFAAVRKRWGRLIVLNLVIMLASIVVGMALGTLVTLLAMVPAAGAALAMAIWVLELAAVAVLSGVYMLMLLVAVNEERWHFDALAEAFRRFFTNGRYAVAWLVYFGISLGCGLLCAVADVGAMFLLLFPPVLTVLAGAFTVPLGLALMTSVYYDQRRQEGYPPDCMV